MIVAGFGYRGAVSVESLKDAIKQAFSQAGLSQTTLAAVAVPSDKAGFEAFQAFADGLNFPVIEIDPVQFHDIETLTRSERVQAKRGTGSVAEAGALIGAGKNARLLGQRVISTDRMASCALAQGEPK
jgi:cobalt-precorrin 5A hydrolase